MRELLAAEQQRQGWPQIRTQLDSEAFGSVPPAPCPQAPEVRRSGDEPSPLARQRFTLHCPGQAHWQMTFSSQANVFVAAVHASTVLERGQTIAASDLRLEEINASKANRGFLTATTDVVGKSVKRRVRTGQLLSPALLSEPLLVRRGERVKIVASDSGIQASASGEALANGERGAVIRVRNLSSEKIIDAKVIEAGVVSSTFK